MMLPLADKRIRKADSAKGQALMEFVLVTVLLFLITVGGANFGIGTYAAHMASDAVQQPNYRKLELSNNTGAISSGTLLGFMQNGAPKSQIPIGSLIDAVQVTHNADGFTSTIVGTKNYQPDVSFIPALSIKVGQVMNRNLLQPAYAGSRPVRSATQPWVPLGAPVKPPWEA